MKEEARNWLAQRMREIEQGVSRAQEVAEDAYAKAEAAQSEALAMRRTARKPLIAAPEEAFSVVPTKLVRDWVRSELLPEVIPRLYDIGMGVQKFDVPTMAGNVVTVPAPASVQVNAIATLIDVGMGHNKHDETGMDELPGVFALGELELVAVQERNEQLRSSGGILASGNGSPPEFSETTGATVPEGHEVVEVDEDPMKGIGNGTHPGEEPPPEPPPAPPTLEQQILARRRMRRDVRGNGGGQ